MARKSKTVSFVKELPQNIFAGFVVSLIALPLGLGLAIAQKIISDHFGEIRLDNHPEVGAVVTLSMPLAGGVE